MFLVVRDEDIKKGLTTDKYFIWTEKILREKRVNPYVVAEFTASRWGIFSGLNDVLRLMEGINVDIYAMPEGTLFFPHEPVMVVTGHYLDFARFETAMLGFICHSSGVSTKAFRAKLAAGDKRVLSFGTRRQHPAIAAMIERAAWIGGVDGVSNVAAEKYLGIESVGTMPHALIISFGDQVAAWRAYDEVVDESVPRTMLVDTYCDEKSEAIRAVENVERVDAVRLDTPSSRRGNIRKIIEEIRWELDIRGRRDVRIVLSGGLDIEDILSLRDVVDAFGVGTSIAGAGPIDFSMDIVERNGEFCAKRGKRSGMKQVYRDWETLEDEVRLFSQDGPEGKEPLLEKVMEGGRILKETDLNFARDLALRQMEIIRRIGRAEEFVRDEV
ncbi:Nicotinic acid phosphoribosyltransferase [Geoglobus ahangari]|uniref:nicotinate phosphoribosyltransferase n=1 Tax=Geoglobus ahangari TaxID=113653 RepID=A0A0F7IGC9_9EURY|nr:nicotinate phosphoribosyltransferase [Geoglobus ahangari]AKG91687.1 Nicotinic acid phosphoribosyltransferase [Geoglobus ahangari]